MKNTRLVIGIVSIVLSVLVGFQSMVAGLGNALAENGEVSGSAGLLLSLFMLVAGIIAIVARKGGKANYVAAIFYILGSLLGFANSGSYGDLKIWSFLALAFGIVFIVGKILGKKKMKAVR